MAWLGYRGCRQGASPPSETNCYPAIATPFFYPPTTTTTTNPTPPHLLPPLAQQPGTAKGTGHEEIWGREKGSG